MAKVAEYKKRKVKELEGLMLNNRVIAIVNMENLPAKQLQSMRAKLRSNVSIRMAKKRLIKLAIGNAKSSKKNLEKLEGHLNGMPALIFTKENPFKLAKALRENKSKAAAKAGQTSPREIIIPAGPTQFAPGPIISDLSAIGLKTGVEAGKVSVREEKAVIMEGEKFSQKLAEVLGKLGITPMEIGLDLVAVYEDGIVYGKEILSLDEQKVLEDMQKAAVTAINLSAGIGYPTKENIKRMIANAYNQAKYIAVSSNIMSDFVAEKMVKESSLQAKALKERLNIQEVNEEEKEEASDGKELPEEGKAKEMIPPKEKKEVKEDIKIPQEKEEKIIGAEGIKTKIEQDFKEEIEKEKKIRENISHDEVEKMAQELKKKGSLREQ